MGLEKGVYFVYNHPVDIGHIYLVMLKHSFKSHIISHQNIHSLLESVFFLIKGPADSYAIAFKLGKMADIFSYITNLEDELFVGGQD